MGKHPEGQGASRLLEGPQRAGVGGGGQRPAWLALVGSLVFAGRTEATQKELRGTLSANRGTAALRGFGALPPGRPSRPGRAVEGERGCKQRWASSTDAPGPMRVVGPDGN